MLGFVHRDVLLKHKRAFPKHVASSYSFSDMKSYFMPLVESEIFCFVLFFLYFLLVYFIIVFFNVRNKSKEMEMGPTCRLSEAEQLRHGSKPAKQSKLANQSVKEPARIKSPKNRLERLTRATKTNCR